MVGVVAAKIVDMERRQRVVDETLEELVGEIDVEGADHRSRERNVIFQSRTAGKVDHDPGQRLVQWDVGAAITRQTGLVAERLLDCLAERYTYVFYRVMAIDVQIAFR